MISGCARDKDELSFAVGGAPNEVEYWEKLLGDFESQHHISVTLLRQPTDTDQRRQMLVIPLKAGEKDPDVFLLDVAWVAQFSSSRWLFPLDSSIQGDGFDTGNIFQGVLNQVDRSSEGIIALPVYLDCGILYYRKDLLEKYGYEVPETWDRLVEIAQRIQKEERKNHPSFYGFVWQGAQYEGLVCNFLEFITAAGGGMEKKEDAGLLSLDREENIKALGFMRDLIHEIQISPPNTFTEMKEEEVRIFFQEQSALFERNWPYAWSLHAGEDSAVRGKVGTAVLPRFEGGRHAAALGGWHIGISRFSDQKEQAWELVKFILSLEVQKRLALDLGWNPGRKDLYEDGDLRGRMPHLGTLKKALDHAVARPSLPYYTALSTILQRHIHNVVAGNTEPREGLVKAQNEIEKSMRVYEQGY